MSGRFSLLEVSVDPLKRESGVRAGRTCSVEKVETVCHSPLPSPLEMARARPATMQEAITRFTQPLPRWLSPARVSGSVGVADNPYHDFPAGCTRRQGIWKLAGGASRELWSSRESTIIGGPAIAPDGRRIAFSAAMDKRRPFTSWTATGGKSGRWRLHSRCVAILPGPRMDNRSCLRSFGAVSRD